MIEVFSRKRFVTGGVSVVRAAKVDRYGRYVGVADKETVTNASSPVYLPDLTDSVLVLVQHIADLLVRVKLHQKVNEKFEQSHLLQKCNIMCMVDGHRDVFHSNLWHRHLACVRDVWEVLEVAGNLTRVKRFKKIRNLG